MKLEDFYINEREFYKNEIKESKRKYKHKLILTIILNLIIITLYVIGLIIILKLRLQTICRCIRRCLIFRMKSFPEGDRYAHL